MADLHCSKVEELAAMLTAAQPPSRAGDAARAAASLAVAFSGGGNAKRSPDTGDLCVPMKLVAGARPGLHRRLCWSAA